MQIFHTWKTQLTYYVYSKQRILYPTMKFGFQCEGNINSDLFSALLTALQEDSTLIHNIKMQNNHINMGRIIEVQFF